MTAVALALGASLAWGASDFLAGLSSRKVALLWVLLVSQLTGLVLVVPAALLAGEPLPGAGTLAWAAIAGVAELVGFVALYRAFAVGTISVVAPIGATAATVPLAVGVAAGAVPTRVQAAGMVLALGGAALASFEPDADEAGRRMAAGIALAIVAALAFGLFFVGMDLAADGGAVWAAALNRAAAVAVLVPFVVAARRPCPLRRRDWAPLTAVGALDIAANTMFAVALTMGLAAAVTVLGSLYPLATVALARVFLRERLAGVQRAGVLSALAGVALVAA